MTINISDEAIEAACRDVLFSGILPSITREIIVAAAPFIIADAVREEREACAKVVEAMTTAANSKHLSGWGQKTNTVAAMLAYRDFEIAAAIRARGEA